jgi:hypothetical protein
MTSTLTFCDRDSELETLLERWHIACDVQGPSPQVVVIKAERGLGKTRLALEFYRWLNESMDGRDGARYWPSAVDVIERNLEVEPIYTPATSERAFPIRGGACVQATRALRTVSEGMRFRPMTGSLAR